VATGERGFSPKNRSAAVVPSGRVRRQLGTAVRHARFLGLSSPRRAWVRSERYPFRPFTLELERWSSGDRGRWGMRILLNTDPSAVLSYLRSCLDAVSVAGTASSRGWAPSRPIRICEETLLAPHPLLRWPAGLAHRQTVGLRRAATSPGSHYPLSSTGPLPLHCS
jgi:hypothetical protein